MTHFCNYIYIVLYNGEMSGNGQMELFVCCITELKNRKSESGDKIMRGDTLSADGK